ncbi:MAG: hypothetical protein R3C44_15135 [Chloroflexota bacterium]
MNEATTGPKRTIWIDLLTLLAVLAGVGAVLDTLRFLGILPLAEVWGLNFYDQNWLGALLAGIVAVIWFMTAYQLWNLDARGWIFVVIIAILNLILLGISAIGGSTWQAVLPGVILSAIVIFLSLLTSTREAFGQA